MTPTSYPKAEKPTIYFIGVTTGKSSIMKVFPAWAKYLNLGDCAIKGIDFALHDDPRKYRDAVAFIKADPLALGALVTTHKLDLLNACRDQFERLDEHATATGEISCISKQGHRLVGHAKDLLTAGWSLEAFLPDGHWRETGAEALVLGAGGSAIAITWYLLKREHGANRPKKIIVANRSTARLDHIQKIHRQLGSDLPVEYRHVPTPEMSDALLEGLPPSSLVVNATGLGKDAPGSPLTDAARFPERAVVWDFNYRGDLVFLQQARAQQKDRSLMIEDGWVYFIHGWTSVIAEVFHVAIAPKGQQFDELCRIAASATSAR